MPCIAPELNMNDKEFDNLQAQHYKKLADESTSLLCEILKLAEEEGFLTQFPQRHQDWWEKHRKFDQSRKDK